MFDNFRFIALMSENIVPHFFEFFNFAHFDYTPDLMTSWTVGNVFSGSNRDTWQTSVPYFLKGKEVKRYGKQKFKLFGANWKDHFYCVREAVGNR